LLPATTNGYVTFGSFNTFCKVNDAVLKLWARVLRTVDCSRLVLLAPEGRPRERVLGLLSQEGVAPDRIRFVSFRPRREYLLLYHQIDIVLDTFPADGHTTSLDGYWMGVPVVTLVGETAIGRAGLCQLTNLGLTELIAHSGDDFASISANLASDVARLTQLRCTLRSRLEHSPLMDAPRFARNVEDVFRRMWRDWCAS
jgi:protein O-GlcNAc transferase